MCIYINVYSSTDYNSPNLERTQISSNNVMVKEIMDYLYNKMLYSNENEWSRATC